VGKQVRHACSAIPNEEIRITLIAPVLITGVSPKSLGESMAFSIASQKPSIIIMASRTRSKMDAVATKIKEAFPGVLIKAVCIDFSSQESVREAAKEVDQLAEKIHILINNAGLMVPEHRFTKEGIEFQFGTNHIGPFLFTNLLMDKMRRAAREMTPGATRIVNVSSSGHSFSPLRFSDYNFAGNNLPPEEKPPSGLPGIILKPGPVYGGFLSYGQSKTANILMSVYLTNHLHRHGILSYSVHPGSE
jgi:NAD(P)-dependent dehydrogenase (short-subunit alcohol dehydrogenase family)